ncbi:hypothetical protein POX_h09904 [Penicillium oxalicum]|uniref:hypothetical protein n=1 Tax=Penicillium oxalicum TaxID=69781 RepID=UPI0020B750A6|nr:hypothetical protein POX_h09904 [Penicillium oxalicum]KAI2786136.1 hypothetical protein POX_h09904 [Penicillium oxalicum]
MPSETEALLGNGHLCPPPSRSQSRPRGFVHHLRDEIDPGRGDLLLLFCYIITGLLDSSAVFIWGSFVSMQTGNTVYFGLGLVGSDDGRWIKSGISIAGFCLGSLFFGVFHRHFSARKRWVLCASFLIQLACVVVAALIVTIFRPSGEDQVHWLVSVPLALVAFQSSGQTVASRVLEQKALTSVVLTSIYCDLFSHPDFLSFKVFRTPEELRRLGAVLCLLLGVVLGGLWAHSSIGMMGALWTAALFKVAIVLAWLLWQREDP